MKALISVIIALAILTISAPVHAQGCGVMSQYGMLPDYDCDGVADDMDNCPAVGNADQSDLNRNGIGDLCDLLIEEIRVNPDNQLLQGEIAHIVTRLINNHDQPLQDVRIVMKNAELGIDASQTIPFIPQGEMAVAEFYVVIPKCAKVKNYDLSVSAQFSGGAAEVQKETIAVQKGTVCGTKNTSLDYTIINVFDKVDIDRGEDVIIPISIVNLGDRQATYDISVQDLGSFGTWRIDPAPRMTLVAGHKDTAYLYLQVEDDAPAGTRVVPLSVTSDGKTTTVPINVYVRAPLRPASPFPFIIFQAVFILLLLVLIIAAIVLARRRTETKPDIKPVKPAKPAKTVAVEKAEEKLETYY